MTDLAFFLHRRRENAVPRENIYWGRFALPPMAAASVGDRPLAALVALGFFAVLLPTAPSLLFDPDMLWHIRTGQEILASRYFPQTDSYSWTMYGQGWIAKEWLSQVLYALCRRFAGWTGVALLALAAACAAYGLVFAALERRAGPLFALAAAALIALAGHFHLLARPHVLAWPVAAAFAIELLDSAEKGRAPRWPYAFLVVLWANLHGSFLLAFALAPFFAWESVARAGESQWRLARRWAGFAALCLLAALVHPYGWRVFAAARDVLALGPALSLIVEWRPQDFSSFGHFEIILLLGLGASLLSGLRLPAPRVALLLALLHSALAHVRQETLGLMVVALLVAAPVAALRGEIFRPRRLEWKTVACAAAGVLAVAVGSLSLRGGLDLPAAIAPQAALAAARAAGVTGQVLNEDQFGGFLIDRHVQTYADGRAELFGPLHYDLSMALAGRKADVLDRLLANRAIGWTLLPTVLPANRVLEASPEWRRVYRDDVASVYARR
ncbi:hypothetical protein [uncultured Rhodoblastus sp.]|uniref:hypothetical protein n=1 Tax=uncultured Rhodoblastus sp. TaxID=543037 RepID=UPI0025D9B8B8|nr:hypothetical protein [uncultured Rhodoblastus sp.]